MHTETLTRQDLHDLVWSQSILSLTKKYAITHTQLQKICVEMNIPLPRQGHWDRVKAGHQITIPPLPAKYNGKPDAVLTLRTDTINNQQKTVKRKPDNVINTETEYLLNTDKMVLAARQSLEEHAKKYSSSLIWTKAGELDIKVSPALMYRALKIMNRLIGEWKKRKHDFKNEGRDTYAMYGNEKVKILLRERTKRHNPTGKRFSTEYIPTGQLYLKAGNWSWAAKEWKDGSRTLEEQIPDIIGHMEQLGKEQQEDTIKREKERQEENRMRQLRKEREQRQDEELERFRQLISQASRWHKAETLRKYIAAFENAAGANHTMTAEIAEWLTWAKSKADWYDPFLNKEDELLNEADKETLTFNREKNYW
jgi:hypothetical protein